MIYVGDTNVEILADCQQDISSVQSPAFSVRKPNGVVASWSGQVVDGKIRYITSDGDLDVPGEYKVHAMFTLEGILRVCDLASFTVRPLYS